MNLDGKFENTITNFCYKLCDKAIKVNKNIAKSDCSGLFITKTFSENEVELNFFRYDLCINDKDIEMLRIFAYKSPVTKDISFSLMLEVKPPRKERRKFKTRLAEICEEEGMDLEGYLFSVKKTYPDVGAMLESDIASHANELLELCTKIKEILARILEQ